MSDTSDHEARFHDHGEHVDEPYPQMSENPLRTGVAKITTDNADGTYVVDEQVHTGAAWTDGEAPGQYMGATVRDINDSTDGDVDDLVFFWEQYDQDGVIELITSVLGSMDKLVATASGETPGYLGDVTAGHDPWIVLTEAGGVITWTHGPPGASCYACGSPLQAIDVDALGHIRWFDGGSGCVGPCA